MIKRLMVNTSSNLFQLLVSMTVTFIMAPIYLSMMGHYDYGIRAVVGSLIGYMGMLDLGMRPTMTRFTATYVAQRDRESLRVLYACSLAFMGGLGLLISSVVWTWGSFFPETITPEGGSADKYQTYLWIIATSLLFVFPHIVVKSFVMGFQRYYITSSVNITFTILIAVISYIYMTPDNALLLLTSLVAITGVIKLIIYGLVLALPSVGDILPNLRFFSGVRLKELLKFGSKSFIQNASTKVEKSSDRLIIGGIMGPSAVPLYTIPLSLVGYLESFTMTITQAFLPLFSDLSAKQQKNKISRVYLFASKIVVGFLIPAGVGVAIIGAPFIHIWMPGEFDDQPLDSLVLLLMLFIVIPKLNPFSSRYLTAIGKHGIFARVAPFAALLNLLLSIWLVYQYGVVGAVVGSVISALVVTPIYLHYGCKYLRFSPWEYIKGSIAPVLVPTAIMGLAVGGLRSAWGLDTYGEILGVIGAGAVVYALAFFVLSLKRDEKTVVLDWLRARARVLQTKMI